MPAHRSSRRPKRGALWLCLVFAGLAAFSARADNASVPDLPASEELRGSLDGAYRLQVFINGHDRKVIAEFARAPDGGFSAKRSELQESGLLPPGDGAMVSLDAIPGLRYRYDEAAQAIYFEAPDALLAPNIYSASGHDSFGAQAKSDIGAALNYDIYSTTGQWSPLGQVVAPGESANLDARLFSPLGVFRQTGIVGADWLTPNQEIRLDTTFQAQDEAHDLTMRVGDTITSGLAWTRPIRIGGAQISRDYSTRPDLVTAATPTVSGSAAVPTTVDVYVNNLKIFEQNVDPGPFQIQDLPMIGAGGDATVIAVRPQRQASQRDAAVLRQSGRAAAGRVRILRRSRFRAPELRPRLQRLRPSARLQRHGALWLESLRHPRNPRRGRRRRHQRRRRRLVQSVRPRLARRGLGGQRTSRRAAGCKSPSARSTAFLGMVFEASTQRTFGAYADLASVTAPSLSAAFNSGTLAPSFSPYYLSTSTAPPRAFDRISVSLPDFYERTALNFAFVNLVQTDGVTSRIASVGLSKNLPRGVSFSANAYVDLANHHDEGVFAGINMQLGGPLYASVQAGSLNGGFASYAETGMSVGQDVGSYGWKVFDAEGTERYSGASATAMTPYGRATLGASEYGYGPAATGIGTAEFAGSLVALGGVAAAGPETGDAFALVKAGAPGVEVLQDNRPVGQTGFQGALLVPNLRPFEDNKIGIDPTTLPPTAVAQSSEEILRPKFATGVVADFAVNANPMDAEIILVDAKGKPLATGASARLGGQTGSQTVGYDGRVYFTGLAAHNVVDVTIDGVTCAAAFDYAQPAEHAPRPTIGPVACK